jgi:hypothetical protein
MADLWGSSVMTQRRRPQCHFGGGMKIRIGTETYRLSFARPANLRDHAGEAADAGDIRGGRRSGAAWKSALAAVTYAPVA